MGAPDTWRRAVQSLSYRTGKLCKTMVRPLGCRWPVSLSVRRTQGGRGDRSHHNTWRTSGKETKDNNESGSPEKTQLGERGGDGEGLTIRIHPRCKAHKHVRPPPPLMLRSLLPLVELSGPGCCDVSSYCTPLKAPGRGTSSVVDSRKEQACTTSQAP